MRDVAVIAGIGVARVGKRPGPSTPVLQGEAQLQAIADAGMALLGKGS